MTVGDLKEYFEELESEYGEEILNMDIYGSCDYGDHCHTEQLIKLGQPRVITPQKTAYSETGLAVPDPDYDRDEGDNLNDVVVL